MFGAGKLKVIDVDDQHETKRRMPIARLQVRDVVRAHNATMLVTILFPEGTGTRVAVERFL